MFRRLKRCAKQGVLARLFSCFWKNKIKVIDYEIISFFFIIGLILSFNLVNHKVDKDLLLGSWRCADVEDLTFSLTFENDTAFVVGSFDKDTKIEISFPYKLYLDSLVFYISATGKVENKRVLTIKEDSLVIIPEKGDKEVYIKVN